MHCDEIKCLPSNSCVTTKSLKVFSNGNANCQKVFKVPSTCLFWTVKTTYGNRKLEQGKVLLYFSHSHSGAFQLLKQKCLWKPPREGSSFVAFRCFSLQFQLLSPSLLFFYSVANFEEWNQIYLLLFAFNIHNRSHFTPLISQY